MKSPVLFLPFLLAAFAHPGLFGPKYLCQVVRPVRPPAIESISSNETRTLKAPQEDTIAIPGPLRSFLRMAGVSQEISREEVLPLLSRAVYLHGRQQGTPTEFLILIIRYVSQARELQILAGAKNTIRVDSCDDAGTLIQILGYRLRGNCGQKDFSLETANPERAFLTIDSGFPLVELEEALQRGAPFTYSYPASHVPVMFHETDWVGLGVRQRRSEDLLDILLSDADVARLYMAISKQDVETRVALERSPGLRALLPYAGVLDFYGSEICIRSGRVMVPGGAGAEAEWKQLVGASPESPGAFVSQLLAKDAGWMMAYFDTLSRVPMEQQERLTQAPRLKRLYESFRTGEPKDSATRGVFRRAPGLLILYSRVWWDPDGQPHVPGDIATWKEIFRQKSDSRIIRDWAKHPGSWNAPEQLLEAMTAFCSWEMDDGPLPIYLMLSEIDRERPRGSYLSPATARLLASRFLQFRDWYFVFTEFPELNDASITAFLQTAQAIEKTSNQTLRGNTLGTFQASVGLWQILARQGQIPAADLNSSWQKVIGDFNSVSSSTGLFDDARGALSDLILASGAKPGNPQEEIVNLLAGPPQQSPEGERVRVELAKRIGSVLEDQRLVSLDTLFALNDGLHEMAMAGVKVDGLLPLAEELREFDLPHPIFSSGEKINWAPPNYTLHHAELQVKTDLTRVIQTPGSHGELESARGQLTPFLRDTLVGLNYAYYEPPGAQMLHHDPLFVRSHDFLDASVQGWDQLWGAPMLLGAGTPAGGGAYLVGSLADLSYALATTEQDFIAPEKVQALIWKEVVPDLLVNATLPRWWNVTPNELHAVTLYQKSGEEILVGAGGDAQLDARVIDIFSDHMAPQRLGELRASFLEKGPDAVPFELMPAEASYLAAEYRVKFPGDTARFGEANQQLDKLRSQYPEAVSWERVSKDFGVPHHTLAQTDARDVLLVKPLPVFESYASRLFGESWESGNLYWARLVDEMGYSPATLNLVIPELTRRSVAKIFATDPEDWKALLRAMQATGQEFRRCHSGSPALTASPCPIEEARYATVQ